MIKQRFAIPIALVCLGAVFTVQAQDVQLHSENVDQWRDHILPGDGDLSWQQIPWLTTFADGIVAADEADKPLLLWTMNGHPLGCT
ncbi:MAG: hypothetical protein ACR2NP_11280 [Pirellulaceae bacterium]